MELKTLPVAFKMDAEPTPEGTIEGYASVFDVVDGGMDSVQRGAFSKSIASGRKVRMFWGHNPDKVIGVWNEIKEDARGLRVKGQILTGIEKGRDVLAMLRGGAVDSLSIGYRTVKAASDGARGVRLIQEAELWEISVVPIPMLDAAVITDVKSMDTIREFEKFLRDAGLSRAKAKSVAAHGFKGFNHRDDDAHAQEQSLLDEINQLAKEFTNG